eukprot:54819-Eustigmatos_ZCMA.PRE.1
MAYPFPSCCLAAALVREASCQKISSHGGAWWWCAIFIVMCGGDRMTLSWRSRRKPALHKVG